MLSRSSVLAVNTCLTNAGSVTTTVRPKTGMFSREQCPVAACGSRPASSGARREADRLDQPGQRHPRRSLAGPGALPPPWTSTEAASPINHSQRTRGTTQYRITVLYGTG